MLVIPVLGQEGGDVPGAVADSPGRGLAAVRAGGSPVNARGRLGGVAQCRRAFGMVPVENTCPGGLAGASRLAGLDMPGHGACQIRAVQDRNGCGEQSGGGQDVAWWSGQGTVGAEVQPADVPADCCCHAGVHEFLAEGPGVAEQRGDDPDVREGAGSGLGRVRVGEEAEQSLLGVRAGRDRLAVSGACQVQAGAAGWAARAPGGGRWPAALRRVQSAVGGTTDELPVALLGGRVLVRAVIHEEHAVLGAGKGDREEPVFPPRAAVLFLDGAPVAAQARRAVADTGGEQPGLADCRPSRA